MIYALIAVALAIPSDPYVRSRVRPATPSDHCLYWTENSSLTWKANVKGNDETVGDTEFDAFRRSFAEWNAQLAGCGSLTWVEGERTSSRDIGWKEDAAAINENILLFRTQKCSDVVPLSDSCWNDENDADDCGNKFDCWEHQAAAIALTTTTYDPHSGRILDADIELNVPGFIFTTVDAPVCLNRNFSQSCVAWDVQNTVTHEVGHMMGLDHTLYVGSTMNPTAPPGETSKRLLDVGTRSFVCDAYPKGGVSKDCVIQTSTGELGAAYKPCGCGSAGGLLLFPALMVASRRRRR
ncbi:MAG: matrixin [Archangiaceae bacterium]|nr:matrixin [Archangiaceae bacterium]